MLNQLIQYIKKGKFGNFIVSEHFIPKSPGDYKDFENIKPYSINESFCFPDKKQYLWEDLWNLFETKSKEKRLSNKEEYFVKQGMELLKKARQDEYYYENKMLAGEIWELLN